jgi:hypothetical protein
MEEVMDRTALRRLGRLTAVFWLGAAALGLAAGPGERRPDRDGERLGRVAARIDEAADRLVRELRTDLPEGRGKVLEAAERVREAARRLQREAREGRERRETRKAVAALLREWQEFHEQSERLPPERFRRSLAAARDLREQIGQLRSEAALFADRFERPGGAGLGPRWLSRVGAFRVREGRAVAPAEPFFHLATVKGLDVADVVVEADVDVPRAADRHGGLVARYSGPVDTNEYIGLLVRRGGEYFAEIWCNGQDAGRLAQNRVDTGRGRLRFEVVGNSLRLFLNGRLVSSARDDRLRRGGVGLRATAGVTFADFSASAP